MKPLYKDEFCEMNFDEKTGIHYYVAYNTTERMNEEQYKATELIWLQTTIEVGAEKAVVDARNMLFPIVPELQEWVIQNIVPKTPVKKSAFIVPVSFIENLAVGQLIDEVSQFIDNFRDKEHKVEGYFATVQAAEAWLLDK